MKLNIAVLYSLLIASGPLAAADFYIDPQNGHPDNNGSAESPWKSLQSVLNRGLVETQQWDSRPYKSDSVLIAKNPGSPIQAGDTIWLKSGDYGNLTISSHYNSDMITIAAESNHTPKFNAITIRSSANWKLSNLHIESEKSDENKIRALVLISNNNWHGPVSNITIEHSSISSTSDSSDWSAEDWNAKAVTGIFSQANHLQLNNNSLLNVVHGISSSGDNVMVENNSIVNFSGDGIRGLGNDSTYQYNLVKNAYKVNNNHDDAFQSWSRTEDGTGTGVVENVTLRGNTFINYDDPQQPYKGSLQGIGCFDGTYQNWTIENNLIISDSWHGITLSGAINNKIINNTVVDIDPETARIPWIRISDHKDGTLSEDNLVRNNLTQRKVIINEDHNTQDHNLIVEDPYETFVDPDNQNYELIEGSPAIDAGTDNQAPAIDIVKTARPQGSTTDLGAYEFIQAEETSGGAFSFF